MAGGFRGSILPYGRMAGAGAPAVPVPVPVPIVAKTIVIEIQGSLMAFLDVISPIIRKGDVGTILRWTVAESIPIDVSKASVKQVKIMRPDNSHLTKDLVFSTSPMDTNDGTDGRVEYKTISDDINQKGTYRWQLFLVFLDWSGHSWMGTFTVEDVLF